MLFFFSEKSGEKLSPRCRNPELEHYFLFFFFLKYNASKAVKAATGNQKSALKILTKSLKSISENVNF